MLVCIQLKVKLMVMLQGSEIVSYLDDNFDTFTYEWADSCYVSFLTGLTGNIKINRLTGNEPKVTQVAVCIYDA